MTRMNLFSSTSIVPCALIVYKRGRRCVVAKLTFLRGGDRPILATAWRSQSGTKTWISVPQSAIHIAEQAGTTHYYLRDDRCLLMWRISLKDLKTRGILKRDGERYIRIEDMEPVPWREWLFAERELDLSESDGGSAMSAEGVQLSLFDLLDRGRGSTAEAEAEVGR